MYLTSTLISADKMGSSIRIPEKFRLKTTPLHIGVAAKEIKALNFNF